MSRVVVRDVCTGFGHHVQSIQVEHCVFRRLLQEQRVMPIRHQWAGSRFREWRRNVNNASQYAADIATCQAWMAQQQTADPRAQFEVIAGGRDGVALDARSNPAWAQEARERWREVDGFARINPDA